MVLRWRVHAAIASFSADALRMRGPRLLDKRGVPCAPVRKPDEVLHDQRLHDSGALMRLPIRFSATPSQFGKPAMALGGANEEVYGGLLKLSRDEIDALRPARAPMRRRSWNAGRSWWRCRSAGPADGGSAAHLVDHFIAASCGPGANAGRYSPRRCGIRTGTVYGRRLCAIIPYHARERCNAL
ncbi:hypothetical protein D9M68_527790 [compost metagenome]